MSEKLKKETFGGTGPDPFSDKPQETNGNGKAGANVDVIHGVYAHSLPLGGLSVKQARSELSNKMNIDPTSVAVVDGNEVPEDHTLNEGEVLTFVKPAGEKG